MELHVYIYVFSSTKYIIYERIVNINKVIPQNSFPFSNILYFLCILTIYLYFMSLFNENQCIPTQMCFSLFGIILKRCFAIKTATQTSFFMKVVFRKQPVPVFSKLEIISVWKRFEKVYMILKKFEITFRTLN